MVGVAHAKECSVGDRAEVLWKSKWYAAQVKKVEGARCYIHYDGYADSWDEWVGSKRIRGCTIGKSDSSGLYSVGTAVQVRWKKKWWPAHVIAVGKNSWKIHYDGYNNSWDEWVGPNRIKK
ncbi:MAG: RNA-binding protein [Deltaproteobacteria bacterium]|nr:RNA-binding protein [Deltaproteobacteria bacterium]